MRAALLIGYLMVYLKIFLSMHAVMHVCMLLSASWHACMYSDFSAGNLSYFAAAAPLQTSNSESREENIEPALKETVSDEYQLEGAPVELQRTDLLQDTRDEKRPASFALGKASQCMGA